MKGREVKVYGLKDQLLIVTPSVTNVKALLLKYASLFGVVTVATVVIGAVLKVLTLAGTSAVMNSDMKKTGIEVLPPAPSAPLLSGNAGAQGVGLVAENGSRALDMKDVVTTAVPVQVPETVYSQLRFQVTAPAAFPVLEVLIAFFLGGCLVIAVLILYELVQQHRNQCS